MAVRQSGFTRAASMGPIARVVETYGGSIDRVFAATDLPTALLDAPDLPLPLREQFRVLEQSGREVGERFFGARLGQSVRVANLGGFGKWISSADRLEGAIARSNAGINQFLQTATNLELKVDGRRAIWSIEFLDPSCEGRLQNELLGVSYLIDLVRYYADSNWQPDMVHTTARLGSSRSELEQIFGAEVTLGNTVSAVEFDSKLLLKSHPETEAGLPTLFDSVAQDPPVPRDNDELQAIVAVSQIALERGYPKADWVADKLGLSRRSMQRKLQASGTSFAVLVEALMEGRARALLMSSDRSVTAIAHDLGYSDTAHFTRAFRRWTGMTPSDFRNG
ncbi:MAG: helix-turn-helix domain-containing protein [Filomicrobium sp.]